MAEERLFMVMDDTANSGKEPYKCKTEQEQREYDAMIAQIMKEFDLYSTLHVQSAFFTQTMGLPQVPFSMQ